MTMAVALDRPREDVEAALRSDRPRAALRSTMKMLLDRGGYTGSDLLGVLEEVRERLHQQGRREDEEVVLDVMDLLDGWAGPHAVL